MSKAGASPQPFFELVGLSAVELGLPDIPRLQRFFEANPEYFISVNGEPAGANEAHEELFGELPAGWPFTKKWVIGLAGQAEDLVAMVSIVSDLLAPGVWHIGLLIVATESHGTGLAQAMFRQLERWAVAGGAAWLRLGVVAGNARAEQFWERCGFVEVRKRESKQRLRGPECVALLWLRLNELSNHAVNTDAHRRRCAPWWSPVTLVR